MIKLGIIATICMLLVARHVWFKREDLTTTKKVVWTIMAIFFSIATFIAYFLFFRKK